MLSRLVQFALTQRLLVLGATLVLAVAGVVAYRGLPIDAFPDVSTTQVKVIMKAPGMTPEEVESRIVAPIELEMLGISHKKVLRSVSKYAIADVTIDFDEGTDIYWARQQVGERLAGVLRDLPASVSGGLAPITTPLGEMLMFTVEGDLPLAERRSILDWTIRPRLRTLPGVADVNALGGLVRSFEVVPDAAQLAARGISVAQLRQALEANNRNDGAGRLGAGEETLLVRSEGSIRSLDDLRAIVVDSRGGQVIRVGEIAEVRIGSLTRYGTVTQDGRGDAVEGLVLGLRGANANDVVRSVHQALAQLAPTLPAGVTTRVFYDRGALVGRAVGTVQKALTEAIVLVLILLVAFLGNVRAALVVALILPLSALATFILMRQSGLTANLMSLGGLSIAIGMLVDAAVVVIENVMTRMAQHGRGSGLPALHVIYRAVKEVAVPVASGILIIIIVFVPLLTLQGLEGKLFAPVALTIVFALSASLLLSLTVIPVVASWLLGAPAHAEPWLVRVLLRRYRAALAWSLAHPRVVIGGALLALALATGVFWRVGKAFMPAMDEGDLIMQIEKLPSIGLEQSAAMDQRLQRAILEAVPEVRHVVARTGADELGLDPMGLNQTDSFLVLKPRPQWRRPDKEWLIDRLREVAARFPGIGFSFTQPIDMRVSEMLTGSRGDVAIKIFGPDVGELNRLAAAAVRTVSSIGGAEDVFTLRNDGVQYVQVGIDRLAAGRLGFTVDEIGAALRSQLEGDVVGTVLEPGRRTPLLLRGGDELRNSTARFAGLTLALPGGRGVPLSAVAQVKLVDGPVMINRENGVRMVTVQANVRGRDLVGFVDEARGRIAGVLALPDGYRIEWGGQFENQQRAAARLATVVPAALAMIFALLFATFGSVRQSILVFANIPFAMIGGVLGLWASGEYLSVPASVGFIALLGIAVLNGVVMVSYFNQLYQQGMPIGEVVVEGAARRLRPVLMTAAIAAFGLVPLLFASGPGSEIQKPLAIVVIGGLVSSTLLTLIILPILYRRFGVDPRVASSRVRASAAGAAA